MIMDIEFLRTFVLCHRNAATAIAVSGKQWHAAALTEPCLPMYRLPLVVRIALHLQC